MTHTRDSGVADMRFSSEAEAITGLKRMLKYLPSSNRSGPSAAESAAETTTDPVKGGEIGQIIPANPNQPYQAKTLIEAVVDEGSFFEVKEHFAKNIVVGFAHLGGTSVGVVANNH